MTLVEIIAKYDELNIKFMEYEYVGQILQCDKSDQETIPFQAERLAFNLEERYLTNEATGGKEFSYEPLWTIHYDNGTEVASAYIKDITPEIVEYWESRTNVTRNPILKARYAGLVWEFKKTVSGAKPNIAIARYHIESLIQIAEGNYFEHSVYHIAKLERAIVLSKKLSLNDLLIQSKETLRNVSNDEDDQNIGIWASPFRISMDYPNVYTKEEQTELVASLQARFDRIANESLANSVEHKPNPWLLMNLADALAPYYTAQQNNDLIAESYRKIKAAFDAISGQLSKLQLVGNLTRLYERYLKHHLPKAETDALNVQITEAGRNIQDEMQVFRQDITIKREEVEAVVNSVLNDDFEQTFGVFAYTYIPRKDQSEKEFAALKKNNPLGFPTILFDSSGRAAAKIGSVENDIGGNLVLYISGKMKFDAVWINATIEEGKKRGLFNTENITAFLHKSPAIHNNRFSIIQRSLKAYFEEDYLTFIHLAIPQIEAAIRYILEANKIPIQKENRNKDAFQLRILDELLRDKSVQDCLTPDFANYLRILLTDNRGWNLRNDVCHGISEPDVFNRMTADRVLHALLCLGIFRYTEENDNAESDPKSE